MRRGRAGKEEEEEASKDAEEEEYNEAAVGKTLTVIKCKAAQQTNDGDGCDQKVSMAQKNLGTFKR